MAANPQFVCAMCRKRAPAGANAECAADCSYSIAVSQNSISGYELDIIAEMFNVARVDRYIESLPAAEVAVLLRGLRDEAMATIKDPILGVLGPIHELQSTLEGLTFQTTVLKEQLRKLQEEERVIDAALAVAASAMDPEIELLLSAVNALSNTF